MYPCSRFVAKYNDYLVRAPHEEKAETYLAKIGDRVVGTKCRQAYQWFVAKLIGTFCFPVAATVDAGANIVRSPIELAIGCLSQDSAHYSQAKKCALTAAKCMEGALGAFFTSMFTADFITRHFVPPQPLAGFIEVGGKLYRAAGVEVQPNYVEEVQAHVRQAARDGKKVTISGMHLSQNKDTLPIQPSVSLSMKKLNGVSIDPVNRTARVQAGATWRDVQEAANRYKLAVMVQQASNIFSVGGSLSVNCHGWDHLTGAIVNTLRSITIVNAQGEFQVLTPRDELFGCVVGGHGLFGVIVEAEIDLTPNEELTSSGSKMAPLAYLDHLKNSVLAEKNNRLHFCRLSLNPTKLLQEAVAVTYKADGLPSSIKVSQLKDEPSEGSETERVMLHLVRSSSLARRLFWKVKGESALKPETVERNVLMRPHINAAFNHSRADAGWLQEFFVTKENLPEFLAFLGKTLTDNQVNLFNATVRVVNKDTKTVLPYAKEDYLAIVLFFNQSLAVDQVAKTKKWVQKVIDYLSDHNGNYYLPYQHFATPEQFRACYTKANVERFIALKHKYDPNMLFLNGLWEDYLQPWDQIQG